MRLGPNKDADAKNLITNDSNETLSDGCQESVHSPSRIQKDKKTPFVR